MSAGAASIIIQSYANQHISQGNSSENGTDIPRLVQTFNSFVLYILWLRKWQLLMQLQSLHGVLCSGSSEGDGGHGG